MGENDRGFLGKLISPFKEGVGRMEMERTRGIMIGVGGVLNSYVNGGREGVREELPVELRLDLGDGLMLASRQCLRGRDGIWERTVMDERPTAEEFLADDGNCTRYLYGDWFDRAGVPTRWLQRGKEWRMAVLCVPTYAADHLGEVKNRGYQITLAIGMGEGAAARLMSRQEASFRRDREEFFGKGEYLRVAEISEDGLPELEEIKLGELKGMTTVWWGNCACDYLPQAEGERTVVNKASIEGILRFRELTVRHTVAWETEVRELVAGDGLRRKQTGRAPEMKLAALIVPVDRYK
jgi:hypothetical protein